MADIARYRHPSKSKSAPRRRGDAGKSQGPESGMSCNRRKKSGASHAGSLMKTVVSYLLFGRSRQGANAILQITPQDFHVAPPRGLPAIT